jgi:hypothetical protein
MEKESIEVLKSEIKELRNELREIRGYLFMLFILLIKDKNYE